MQQELLTIDKVKDLISAGETLLLAGEESLLEKLPKGKWIGGTIPYFISSDKGGLVAKDKIFVTNISMITASTEIKIYTKDSLGEVYSDAGDRGFSFIIIPASSEAHISFALNAPNYKDFGSQPLIGWISGVHLDELGKVAPKTFDGNTGGSYENEAVVMHVTLKEGKTVDVGIINSFQQGDGDTLTFDTDGFSNNEVMVNGVKEKFAAYMEENNFDTKFPLVADYCGAMINTSFQQVDDDGVVHFYAPVFKDVQYKHAKQTGDYAAAFNNQLLENNISGVNIAFSCNCILNYLFSGLEGQKTDPFVGPITFGEIAYQLLNQTLVYLTVIDS
ncbi:DUF6976 family protein [Maridesulfovibrio bastinii]|uniref:DUF6976 family protein n=1 Tax=Maridesulfovibrio bastinii TaxID=47157 RepID=UPI00041A7447|nr:hypothetical protein [Maridesulfovibrio bastinii]